MDAVIVRRSAESGQFSRWPRSPPSHRGVHAVHPGAAPDRERRMKVVYEAAHLIDAHLVKHALEDAGIPVFLRGEQLVGGFGELPLFGVIGVCVPEAAWPEADAIVRALDLGQPRDPLEGEDGSVVPA